MRVSYHNHTEWSDGCCSLEDQVAAAQRIGLDELGISDHYVLAPDGRQLNWSMPVEWMGEYVARVRAAAAKTSGLHLRLGLEADYFPETVDALRTRLESHPFDYIIGSIHEVDGHPVDSDPRDWDRLREAERNQVWSRYWELMRGLAESRAFDIVGHLDLPKKFGHRCTVDVSDRIGAALDAIAASGMAMELNTSGWHRRAAESYPSLALLQAACERGIPLSISADAHEPGHLERDFERARALAREAGYSTLSRFEGRRRFEFPLL